MRRKRSSASRSELLRSDSIFGPPPLLEGEDPAAYEALHTCVSKAVRPTDFIDEIWVREAVDVKWDTFRLRRNQAAYLSALVRDAVDARASSLAVAEARRLPLKGTAREEMDILLDYNSELSWESRTALYSDAHEKYQELRASAKATLDTNEIRATVIAGNLDSIERFEHLITINDQRFDAIIRELDRHRSVQKHLDSNVKDVEEAKFNIVSPKTTIRQITNKKAA
jgi:hypothetical protein